MLRRGALAFRTAPDFERPGDRAGDAPAAAEDNRYVVLVSASSGTGDRMRSARQTITVTVTDVEEPPGRAPAPVVYAHGSNLTVAAARRPPANTGPEITDYDVRYRVKDADGFIDWRLDDARLSTRIGGLERDRTYEVQVRASNAEGTGEWSPSTEATLRNKAPVAVGALDDLALAVGGAAEIVYVKGLFRDPDHDTLTLAISSSDETVATASLARGLMTVRPLARGAAAIAITARDPYGASADLSLAVTVEASSLQAPAVSSSADTLTLRFQDSFGAGETRAYAIRFRHKQPRDGWHGGCATATNPAPAPAAVEVTLSLAAAGLIEPGAVHEVDYGHAGAACGGAPARRSPVVEHTPAGAASFDIDVVFVGGAAVSAAQRAAIEAAAARWERVIAGGIGNVGFADSPVRANDCAAGQPAIADTVDDLRIYVRVDPLDGPGGALASARPCVLRGLSWLPAVSAIRLDADDLNRMTAQGLERVMLHEIGHALGFMPETWSPLDLYRNAPEAHFIGRLATAAFDAAGGSAYVGPKVPLDASVAHWPKSLFGAELMTPGIASVTVLSAITAQAMADIGYAVDVAQADAFALTLGASGASAAGGLVLGNCVAHGPGPAGTVGGSVVAARALVE